MKPVFALLILAAGAHAQLRDNRTPQINCDNNYNDQSHQRFCEIREQTVPGVGRLTVDTDRNGGVTVKGWLRNDVLIRSRVESWAGSVDEARALTALVRVDAAAGQVKASGPQPRPDAAWSVSYEIFVPQMTDLNTVAFNGGISLSDIRGHIGFNTQNGGVQLTRLAGDVSGQTQNGGIQVELAGMTWEGGQLEARTTNGGVTVAMPANYSARIQTGTVNGAVDSDFPVSDPGQGRVRRQNLDFSVGSGGPLIHVSTTNGGVRLRKI